MRTRPLLLCLWLLALGACTQVPQPRATLAGEVYYLQRIALPPEAVLDVSLQDVSLADAPAVELGKQSGPTEGRQVPLPFSLTYNPNQLKAGHRYAVSARIEVGGKLLWINTEQHSVTLDGQAPSPLRIRLEPVHTGAPIIH